MARGGGSRGGSFGGSRGGGFRGGSSRSYRSSRRHHHHRSHYRRPYYGRPYYGRRYYRGGYYGAGNALGGLVIFGIILMLVVPFIFSAIVASNDIHTINLPENETQAIKFNRLTKGNIDFQIVAGSAELYILDFEPTLTGSRAEGSYIENNVPFTVSLGNFEFFSYYMNEGSQMTVTFSGDTLLDYYVVEEDNFDDWKDTGRNYEYYLRESSHSHIFNAPESTIYYFILDGFLNSFTVNQWIFTWSMTTHNLEGQTPLATGSIELNQADYKGNWIVVKSTEDGTEGSIIVISRLSFVTTYLLSLIIFGALIIFLIRRGIRNSRKRRKNRRNKRIQAQNSVQQSTIQPSSHQDMYEYSAKPANAYRTRPTPKYCAACGAGLVPSSRFCEECGTAVE